jgi:hypothetical protein
MQKAGGGPAVVRTFDYTAFRLVPTVIPAALERLRNRNDGSNECVA